MSESISCPHCHGLIELTSALSSEVRKRMEQELTEARRVLESEIRAREAQLKAQQSELAAQASRQKEVLEKALEEERERLRVELKKQERESIAVELKDLESQLQQTRSQLQLSQQNELELRKERRELDERWKNLDLETARREDELRKKLEEEISKRTQEEQLLRLADKEKVINDLKVQISELKRKSELGSQQAQGEVLEIALESQLAAQFPYDTITPVGKGKTGGDVLQEVVDPNGLNAGTIIWESKRTKGWQHGWLPKLRDDQRAARAELAVLVSQELPKGVETFALLDGVWVSTFSCALPLAMVLRETLIRTAHARRANEGQQGKMEILYSYLAGPEFKQRLEGIAETFHALRVDLEAEKRAMQRIWAKREKQLERAVVSASGLHGDLQGIIGASMQEISYFSLEAIAGIEHQVDEDNGE